MRRLFVIMVAILASAFAVQAQNTSGLLFNRDIIPASSFLTLSQRESVGTARSMGLGGAFTSLGGDMASFGYNPAGFGMYQRNEISVSLGLGVAQAQNRYYANDGTAHDMGTSGSVRVSINNFGAAFKIYEGSGKFTALNFAVGYNKVADYNYTMSYEGPATISSLADAFADIANRGELGINENGKICDTNGYFDYEMNPYYWGTALAYKGGLINRGANGWYPDEIAGGANIAQCTSLNSRGSAGEFSFALGFNISNIFYFGASIDIQSIQRKLSIVYSEYINYEAGTSPDAATYPYVLRNFEFGQTINMNGAGLGAKFGFVLRPVKGLRIGWALHTPSYYSITYSYSASLSSVANSIGNNPYGWEVIDGNVYAEEATPTLKDGDEYRWRFTTPTRILTGVSYTFGQYAVVSADYQFDAYRGLRLKYAPADPRYTNDTFRNDLKGVHTVRMGVEVKPLPWLSLRVGGGCKSKVLADRYDMVAFSEPVADRMWYASAGVGLRLSKVTSIDVAYQYRRNRYSDYNSFYTQFGGTPNASPLYGLDILNHNIALTFAFRF